MQIDRASARAGYVAGRKSALAELEAFKAEHETRLDAAVATLRADAATIFRQLQDAKDQLRATELAFHDFRAGVTHDKQMLAEINRERMIVQATMAQREPDTLLH